MVVMDPLSIIFTSVLCLGHTYGVCDVNCSQCEANDCVACNYGNWGRSCNHKCINCWFGGCEKETGRCFQCEPGYFGAHCDKHCPENCWSSLYEDRADCNRHTGECLEACNVGWWGDQCQNRCFAGCQGACYQPDGACVSDCNKGLFGRFCNISCSRGCAKESCDWFTGTCHGGCKCGYRGETCEDKCSINCNTPCKFDDESQCLTCVNICEGHCRAGTCYQNGSCVDGCQAGFYGKQCLRSCPLNCSVSEKAMGCSCVEEMKSEGGVTLSKVVKEVVETEDERSKETKLDVETQPIGGGSIKNRCFPLFISFLILGQSL